MAAGLGFKTFATGDVLTAADTNGYLMSQTVMVFADSAARTAAITSPQQGMVSFLKGTNSTEYYNGSTWVAISGGSSSGLAYLTGTTFSGVTGFSLPNSTFSSTYDNYRIIIAIDSTSGMTGNTMQYRIRMRASGTDNSSSNYYNSRVVYYTGYVAGQGGLEDAFYCGTAYEGTKGFLVLDVINPFKTVTTQLSGKTHGNQGTLALGADINADMTVTTSYDSLSYSSVNGTVTGSYKVYGYSNS